MGIANRDPSTHLKIKMKTSEGADVTLQLRELVGCCQLQWVVWHTEFMMFHERGWLPRPGMAWDGFTVQIIACSQCNVMLTTDRSEP